MPTNPTYPGVYIEEIPSGVHTIVGVATSIAAFFGRTAKGPLNKAVRCFNYSDFTRAFGGAHPDSDLGQSVKLFFDNGGTECYVVRLMAGGQKASITLTDIRGNGVANSSVLTATAKTKGLWGNGLRLEINYNTSTPDETFNLVVIYVDGGHEVARETHFNLSMDSKSSRFAPTFVSQSSNLIDLELHADIDAGGPNDMTIIGNSFAGYSQGRAFKTVPIANFRTLFEGILAADYMLEMDVDGSGYIPINLENEIFGTPAPKIALGSSWSLQDVADQLTDVINAQLGAAVSGLSVRCDFISPGGGTNVVGSNPNTLRITANSGDKRSVRIRRSASNDLAVPLMLGLDQGGIEVARYSNFRPVPTAAFFHDTEKFINLAALTRDVITSIDVDGNGAVTFDFSAMTTAATDLWFVDQNGKADGIREKLRTIVNAVNNETGYNWRAELWGYHLAFINKDGSASVNKTVGSVVSAPNVLLGGNNFTRNVKQYPLGDTGTGSFQLPGGLANVGQDGTAPLLPEFQGNENDHTGFYALDLVDIFNLMVIPGDKGIDEPTHFSLWGPASIYCQKRRAFLLIDSPKEWTQNDQAHVVQDTSLVGSLRASVTNINSAVFYPRLRYKSNGLMRTIGASGAIAGLMARTDATRGVWKAPAGTEADLRGILGLEIKLTDMENGVLNKLAANCLREFPGSYVCWGSRTMDGYDDNTSADWKYIPVRRLALFLEESLFRGTKWVVFEPNDEPLWAKIRLNVGAFMMRLFRQGAFQGSTPDKAFYVKCDSETTPQADINLGIVNIEVGFAPLKPAEFVIIKIQQMAGEL
jgi:phage tail sheath protein FI